MFRTISRSALCVAAAVTASLLAACGSSSDAASAAANPYHLLTPGVILAGTQSAQPPFVVADANGGTPKGFAVDLAEETARRLGLRIEYKVTDLQGLLAGLAANRYDMGVAGVGATAERKKNVDFIKPYYWGYVAILTKRTSTADSLDDFAGKRVGVVSGSVQETFANAKVPGAAIVKFKDQPTAIGQLLSDGIQGMVLGGADAEEYVAKEPTLKAAVEADTTQGTSFPVKKGNQALVDAFDTTIDAMIADGTYLRLYTKWFKRPPSTRLIEFRPGLAKAIPAPSASQ